MDEISVLEMLAAADPRAPPPWQPEPDCNLARIVKVYDGDTVTGICSFDGGRRLRRCSLRIHGIDCPEIRGRGAREKAAAVVARDFVHAQCFDRVVQLDPKGIDKYGRILASLTLDGQDLAEQLLARGFARSYAGAARTPFTDDEIDSILAQA